MIDGELRPVPLSPPAFFMSSLIDGSTKWALVRDILGKSFPPDGDECVAAFVRRKFSPQLSIAWWALSFPGFMRETLSGSVCVSAFPQLYEAEKTAGSILRACFASQNPRKALGAPHLQSFREGSETLVRALADNSALRC